MLKGVVGVASALLANICMGTVSEDGVCLMDGDDQPVLLPAPPPPPAGPGIIYVPDISDISRRSIADLGFYLGPLLYVSFGMVVTSLHLYLIRIWHPTCSVTFFTRLRVALLWIALWGQTITLFMLLLPWDGWLVVLLVTWILAFVGLIGQGVYRVFCGVPPSDESDTIKELRERDRQEDERKRREKLERDLAKRKEVKAANKAANEKIARDAQVFAEIEAASMSAASPGGGGGDMAAAGGDYGPLPADCHRRRRGCAAAAARGCVTAAATGGGLPPPPPGAACHHRRRGAACHHRRQGRLAATAAREGCRHGLRELPPVLGRRRRHAHRPRRRPLRVSCMGCAGERHWIIGARADMCRQGTVEMTRNAR